MPKKIIVDIDNSGNIKIETDGYKGSSCIDEIKEIMSEYFEIDNFDYKSDYYEEVEKELGEIHYSL